MPRVRARLAIAATALAVAVAPVAAANAAALGARKLRGGSHGADVAALQRALTALGYRVGADGVYGRQTARAVIRYERAHHYAADGVVTTREGRLIAKAAAAAARPKPQPAVPVPAAASGHSFPVAGAYSFGTAGNRFGAPRSGHVHQGQDLLAAEGTPVVAATAGSVYTRAFEGAGYGNYLVIRGGDGFDYVYAHLRDTALPAPGAAVAAGQQIGLVGHTGDATAPHLHFEMWTPHWGAGGQPVDPLPSLIAWAGA